MLTSRTRVKICGITNVEDAQAAIAYGADALGFIFVPDTPRYMGDRTDLIEEVGRMPPFVARVAVCNDPDTLTDYQLFDFDTIQFYTLTKDDTLHLRRRQIYAVRVQDTTSLDAILYRLKFGYVLDAVLLDTYHKDKLGGAGETFDWELAVEAKRRFEKPIILAGGLTPENVEEAIQRVRPYAVDVSSGVEAEPGRKDHDKLRRFFEAVRRADDA